MRSCLKACCVATVGLVFSSIAAAVGCGDSDEPPRHTANMGAESQLDGGGRAETANTCVGAKCDDTKTNDHWNCPADTASVHSSSVRYNVRVVDLLSGMPRKELKVKACRVSDLDCESPVATFVDSEQTGQVQLDLPAGFLGFFELTSDAVDTLLYITSPITENTRDRDLTVPTPDTIDLLVSQLDTTWDRDKGVAVLEALDCSGTPQAGIHFDCAEGGDGFYMVDQAPDKNAQTTVYDPTTNTAEGGFVNVPPGLARFSARLQSEPEAAALGSVDAQIRPRTLTIIEIHP